MKKILLLSGIVLAAAVVWAFSLRAARASADYTVHEWGTFTSVQGGDGKLLAWMPLLTSELPGFVHNWDKPELNRSSTSRYHGKGGMITLQRMETPVIYFYAKTNLAVDVSVDFPKGVITEWYPQASQIGPSVPADTNLPGAQTTLAESRAVWKNLQLAPSPEKLPDPALTLPEDKKGRHYFAARATAANLVQMNFSSETRALPEIEKYIFYRGAGSFSTPLRMTVSEQGAVAVENSGAQKLSQLILVSIHNGQGAFAVMDDLPAGKSAAWLNLAATDAGRWKFVAMPDFQNGICTQMESALMREGLFADEAKAMVNTWQDSWFAEEGKRVLYILPRAWTDEILPLTINPAPTQLTRVMVGRAEVITPAAINHFLADLEKVQPRAVAARNQAMADLKSFGRFAGPALNLVNRHGTSTNILNLSYQLFSEASAKDFAARFGQAPATSE